MKFQVNLTVTAIGTNSINDAELSKQLKLGKNEVAAIDLDAVMQAVTAELAGKVQPCRRSKNGNLSITFPLKVEGSHLRVVNVADQPAKASSKKTDAERRQELLSELEALER